MQPGQLLCLSNRELNPSLIGFPANWAESVYEKSLSLCSGKAAEHERDHGNVEKGFGMLRSGLVVADQA
ncbi:MAG: hypothetical protein ACYC23_25025, partial [Limisphaerales bacterium]